MRQAIARVGLALGIAAAFGCQPAIGQWGPLDAYRRIAGKLTDPPEMVVIAYLQHRRELTGVIPVVYLCPGLPVELWDGAFRAHLVSGRRRLADRIEKASDCNPDIAMTPPPDTTRGTGQHDRIWILSIRQTRETSELSATARPGEVVGGEVFASIRSERLLWDHARDIGGQSLIFERFQSWPH